MSLKRLLAAFLITSALLAPGIVNAAPSFDVDSGGTLTTGLAAWYNMEADSSDETTNNRDGTDTNSPTYSSGNGKIVNGLGYDGSTNYTSIPYFPWGTNTFSVCTWYKNNSDTVFSLFGVNNGGASGVGVDYGGDGGAGTFSFTKSGVANITYAWTADNNWNHLCAVQSASAMKLYLNNTEVASGGNTGNALDPGSTVHIGRRNLTNNQYYAGAIDLFGVWTKALSTTEISDLYNSGNGNAYREQVAAASPQMQFIWY